MKTNVKITKINNSPTTSHLKLMHWLMHLELSGGSGEGAGAGWKPQPESRGNPLIEIKKLKLIHISQSINPKTII